MVLLLLLLLRRHEAGPVVKEAEVEGREEMEAREEEEEEEEATDETGEDNLKWWWRQVDAAVTRVTAERLIVGFNWGAAAARQRMVDNATAGIAPETTDRMVATAQLYNITVVV